MLKHLDFKSSGEETQACSEAFPPLWSKGAMKELSDFIACSPGLWAAWSPDGKLQEAQGLAVLTPSVC